MSHQFGASWEGAFSGSKCGIVEIVAQDLSRGKASWEPWNPSPLIGVEQLSPAFSPTGCNELPLHLGPCPAPRSPGAVSSPRGRLATPKDSFFPLLFLKIVAKYT